MASPSDTDIARWVRSLVEGDDVSTAFAGLAHSGERGVVTILEAKWPSDRDYRDLSADLAGGLTAIANVDPKPVVDALRTHPHEASTLVWVLGNCKHPDAIGPLIEALAHRNASVRWAAAVGLERTRPPEALEPLLARLRDRSSNVRRVVVMTVAEYDDPRIVPALEAYRERYNLMPGEENAITEALARFADRGT
jgi:hypothetical protein